MYEAKQMGQRLEMQKYTLLNDILKEWCSIVIHLLISYKASLVIESFPCLYLYLG